MQPKCLLVLRGELTNHLPEESKLFARNNSSLWGKSIEEVIEVRNPVETRARLLLPHSVDGEVSRDLKQIGPQKTDGAEVLEFQHADIGFLGHLSGGLDVFEARRQEEHERSVMLAKKP